ncbi:unnamed protein product [Bursaphelenchus xylophilus]|uniref:(pine wood nematode) hypothetical protein n=1 Tax=Bursaphelenchus xylophilus TaxID=6326 RepID=A0A1I7SVA4_BURXY|nr:unnamed protein product [Bursaphelenchus xylophilus]CAG9101143.1 unnamed protein product [Bursaphelenchus xylophilus]
MPTFDCPPPFDEYYCLNGGRCLADSTSEGGFAPFCQCQVNFSGPRCQNTLNPNVYGFATVGLDSPVRQYMVLSMLLVAFIIVSMGCLWYLCRSRDRQDNETVTFISTRPLSTDGSAQTSRSSVFTV